MKRAVHILQNIVLMGMLILSSIIFGMDSKVKFSPPSLEVELQERPSLHKAVLSGNFDIVESMLNDEIALERIL